MLYYFVTVTVTEYIRDFLKESFFEDATQTAAGIALDYDLSYDKAKKHVFPQLMSDTELEANDGTGILSWRKLDFNIILYYIIKDDTLGNFAAVPITNDLTEMFSVPRAHLLKDAFSNSERHSPARIMSIGEAISDPVPLSSKLFYVLTNDRKHLGAVTMFYSGVLKGFRERLGCDFRIIPSSVHKVLLVPEHVDRTDADLRDILLDVNADAEVSEQELASHIYSYDPDTDEVEIVEVD